MRLTERQKTNLRNLNKKAEDKIEVLKRSGVIDLDFKIKRGYFRSEKAYRDYRKEVNNMLSGATTQYQFVSIGSGKKISKATKSNLQSLVNEINKNKKEDWNKIKNQKVKTGQGEKKVSELVKYGMGNTKYSNLANKTKLNLKSIDSNARLKKLEKDLQKRSSDQFVKLKKTNMQENFILAMKANGFKKSQINKVQKLSPDKFYQWYMTNDVDFSDFNYFQNSGYKGVSDANTTIGQVIEETL